MFRLVTLKSTSLSLISLLLIIVGIDQQRLAILALENGIARTPPAGWIAWQRFVCETDESLYPGSTIGQKLFEEMGKQLKKGGFLANGYEYVNIDDCWNNKERESKSGKLVPNSTLFPDGIANLASKIHKISDKIVEPTLLASRSNNEDITLKLGIYGDCGLHTCAGHPGLLLTDSSFDEGTADFMQIDAETLIDWKIDSYKMDGCYVNPQSAEPLCSRMGPLLTKLSKPVDRPILVTCEWPFYMTYAHIQANYSLVAETCNLWRFYDDIEGPGHWFDPDQLVIGNNGLSRNQAESQMALWSIWSAPLMMSNDLRNLTDEDKSILLNQKLLSINRDPLGVWGQKVEQLDTEDGSYQVFVKPITPINTKSGCPSFAILYFSRRIIGKQFDLSFNLRSILTKAPIYAAANNELSSSSSVSSASTSANKLIIRLDKQGQINGATCLRLLEQASGDEVQFLQEDATRQSVQNVTIRLDANLTLSVEPSGVRVVKLHWL